MTQGQLVDVQPAERAEHPAPQQRLGVRHDAADVARHLVRRVAPNAFQVLVEALHLHPRVEGDGRLMGGLEAFCLGRWGEVRDVLAGWFGRDRQMIFLILSEKKDPYRNL